MQEIFDVFKHAGELGGRHVQLAFLFSPVLLSLDLRLGRPRTSLTLFVLLIDSLDCGAGHKSAAILVVIERVLLGKLGLAALIARNGCLLEGLVSFCRRRRALIGHAMIFHGHILPFVVIMKA